MLDELGPTFVKFGQLLSTRPDIVPADILQELAKLQDQVSPFDYAVVEEVVEQELGLRIDRLFESFESEPIASASIGQVHAAVLPGGRRVVVKVQRPEAARLIRKDLDLLLQFAELLEDRVDVGVSPIGVVKSSHARSLANSTMPSRLEMPCVSPRTSKTRPTSQSPRSIEHYCSNRVLTMERFDGPTLNSAEVAGLDIEERRVLAQGIARVLAPTDLARRVHPRRPHPANIVYLGGGRFGMLDFGMAGFLRAEDLEEGTKLLLHVMHSDIRGVKRSLRRLGVQWSPSADDLVTEAIEENSARYFGTAIKEIDVRSLIQQVFDVIYALRLRLPSRFFVLDKALLTLEGVVGQLCPELNLFEIAREFSGDLKRRLVDPRRVVERAKRYAAEYAQIIGDYPFMLHDLLEEMRAGELEIKYRHTGLEEISHRLDLITNRLVVALVSIALGISSTAVAILIEGGPHVAGLSVWGLPGFAGSLFFGLWLIYAIIRSGRL